MSTKSIDPTGSKQDLVCTLGPGEEDEERCYSLPTFYDDDNDDDWTAVVTIMVKLKNDL